MSGITIIGLIIICLTLVAIMLINKLIVVLFRWHAEMCNWYHNYEGVTLTNVLCFPIWIMLSIVVIILSMLGCYAVYAVAKDVRNWARRKS
jgi:amino acid transporter